MSVETTNHKIKTVAFWGGGATVSLGMATTKQQNGIFLALSKKVSHAPYRECLLPYREDVYGDCFDDVCDLLTLIDDDVDTKAEKYAAGYRMSGFSDRQLDIISRHADELGNKEEIQRNRIIMMRLRYDWAAAMRILRLLREDVKEDGISSDTFTQKIYNLLDAHMSDNIGMHVFDDSKSVLSNFLDVTRLKAAKSALVMFINLTFAAAWANKRNNVDKLSPYARFGDMLAAIRAREAQDSVSGDDVEPVFSTTFVSMNFDPLLWWFIKNADARYNRNPIHVGNDCAPLYLGEDVDQVDAVRRLGKVEESVSDGVLPESAARFVNERGVRLAERCLARYQTVKILFPHGSPNLKICPCCGKTTLYQGNELSDSSESLFPPFFFRRLTWNCTPADALHGAGDAYDERQKWSEGELDHIQCRHCGRAIRMCDTEMVMQSGLKSPPSYLLQRISHNMDNAVMNANHIVLMGYGLPPDDGAMVAELQARTTRENKEDVVCCSVVGFVENGEDRWLYGAEAEAAAKNCEAVDRAIRIFGKERVRCHLKGIPAVFSDEEFVRDMLYPTEWIEKLINKVRLK